MIYGAIEGLTKPLPRILFGTLALAIPDEAAFSLLDTIKETGCYAFDTARVYGDGAAEKVLGKWMESRENRSEIIIIDKGAHPVGGKNRVNPEHIKKDLRESLGNLKTDYIDLFMLHRDNTALSVGPIIDVLNDLKDKGSITCFGASNWTRDRLEEAGEYAEKNGLEPFSVSSNQYSLAIQYDNPYPGTMSIRSAFCDPEWDWYKKTQFPLLCWSGLARGFFSGKFTRDNLAGFVDQQSLISIRCYAREDNFLRLDRARLLAEEKEKTIPQIALAYILRQPINSFVIIGSLNKNHVRENIEALEMSLTDNEVAWLDLQTEARD